MDQKLLREREARCVQESLPGCAAGCPVHVDARGLIAAARREDWAAALALYRRSIPFPGIISRVCDQPCRQACKRGEIGDPIEIRALERLCVAHDAGSAPRLTVLPAKNKTVAVAGAGLSGLTAAFELACKGYRVTVFEAAGRAGGSVGDVLSREVIDADLAVFSQLPVQFIFDTAVGGAGSSGRSLALIREEYDAVYLAVGAQDPGAGDLGLVGDQAGGVDVEPRTMAAALPGVFAGGSLRRGGSWSPIASVADGRSAAISIDRYLQNVSLTAGRDKEGPYATTLYTSIAGVEPRQAVSARDPAAGYTLEEGLREAGRCLACECRECVKVCEYMAHYGAYPKRYVREVYNNLSIVMGIHHANKMINTCSLCGLCKEICPGGLDMGEVCLEARQMMVGRGKMPPSAHDFALRDMEFSCGEGFALSRHQPGFSSSAAVFYPGCQQAASSPQYVRKMYEYLCGKLPGGVGLMLDCCGAPAGWAGRQDLLEAALAKTEAEWRSLGSPRVITACPTCFRMFKDKIPAMEVETLWTLLDRTGLPEISRAQALTLAVHDSCTTRHERQLQDSVRRIIGSLGHVCQELGRSRDLTTCCGYGGLMMFANREVAAEVVDGRNAESPADYVTYCAMCRDNFAGRGKRAFYLLELLFAPGVAQLAGRQPPGYSERRENRAGLKRALLRELWGECPPVPGPAVKIIIPDSVRAVMNDRRILDDDVARVVAHAEATGDKLRDSASGRYLACFRPESVTYWAEYSPAGDGFVIHNAYSHRIEILK